jgi:hypothetical protein
MEQGFIIVWHVPLSLKASCSQPSFTNLHSVKELLFSASIALWPQSKVDVERFIGQMMANVELIDLERSFYPKCKQEIPVVSLFLIASPLNSDLVGRSHCLMGNLRGPRPFQ